MPSAKAYQDQLDMLRRGSDPLRIAYTSSPSFLSSAGSQVKSLIVFDSSFNPPTIAHLELVNRTLANRAIVEPGSVANVLLLLAVQNADKPTVPAPLADRLAMMEQFSLAVVGGGGGGQNTDKVNVAVGITKHARFVDKADGVFGMFPGVEEQIYLTGYDTLIRLLDAKYYPNQTLEQALGRFMARCKIVCYIRDNPNWGTAADQVQFVDDIRAGKKPNVPQAWASRIWLLSYYAGQRGPIKLDLALVSSTAARAAASQTGQSAEGLALNEIVPHGVMRYIVDNKLYVK
ncbi:hypothetical protein V1517DRAFT_311708 [Lipomyces orientalis]|uniref:Uncharacterized protein n=1 Tax=Lipomyces orientalis TaxID=1233043 RepID=A0ACC3TZA0_9ASCO